MRAGNRDRRITLLRQVTARDTAGGERRSYEEFRTVWAELLNPSAPAGEETSGAARTAPRRLQFRILFLAGVTTTMRVSFDGEELDVVSVEEPERRKVLVITAVGRDVTSGA